MTVGVPPALPAGPTRPDGGIDDDDDEERSEGAIDSGSARGGIGFGVECTMGYGGCAGDDVDVVVVDDDDEVDDEDEVVLFVSIDVSPHSSSRPAWRVREFSI